MGQQRRTTERRTMPLGSAPVGMDWEGHPAFDDDFIITKHRALTLPAQHESTCTGFGGTDINTGSSMPMSAGEDRLTVNLVEWRKGYSYSVEIPQPEMPRALQRSSECEVWPSREPLDQSGSNDFSAYEEIQELKDACVVFSPRLATSPFAKQTQQPFVDSASCRSRLSDYGFTTDESDNEQDWECCYGDDMVTPVKGEGPPEDCGFWAEVGAIGSYQSPSMSHEVSCDTAYRSQQGRTANKGVLETPRVVWEVNEWDSPSNQSKVSAPSPELPSLGQHASPQAPSPSLPGQPGELQGQPSPKRQAVLLPWDMM